MRREDRPAVAIVAQVHPSRLATPRDHLVKRRVVFRLSVHPLIIVVVDEQMRDVVDHHDLFKGIGGNSQDGRGDGLDGWMVPANSQGHRLPKTGSAIL